MDPENGSDSLNGQSILRLTGCAVTNNSTTLTVPLNTVGITAGMIVLSLDMNNSGGLIAYGTTVSSITGNSVTLNKVAIGTSSNATIVFSSAIKTLNGIGSKVAAGDTVRIKKSPDALSVGQNVTWTLGSQSVTLATPVNVTLDNCDSMWSNGASIPGQYVYTYGLSSAPATNAQHVKWTILQATDSVAQGNNSLYFAIRSYVGASTTSAAYSAFKTATDGTYTVFYKDLGQTIDLTNYQQISMWCANSFTTGNVGTMKLCLCSDAYGAVVENSFTIPNRGWGALVFDNGAPLSSKVRSISIRIENRVGPAYANGYEFDTIGLRLDNVVVSKAKGAADEITHLTLIGKNPDLSNTEQWYSVRSIESGKINIDHWNKSGPSTVPGYYNGTGVSESGPLYKRECFYLNTAGVNTPQPSRTANAGTTPSGLPDQVITISGGWDATNMSSQTGMSFFDDNQTAYYFAVGAYNVVEKLGFYRNGYSDVNYGVTLVNGNGTEIKDCYFGNNYCGLAVAAGVRGTALTRLRGNNTLANYVYLRAYSYGTKLDRCEFVGSEASGVYLESMYTSNSNYDGADKITIINS
ncbi:MAG: hypothetical protein EBV30_09995, partial [Actinobacteria bacterium]|nr:hypothetical protein [Actinomycetota bacterium]